HGEGGRSGRGPAQRDVRGPAPVRWTGREGHRRQRRAHRRQGSRMTIGAPARSEKPMAQAVSMPRSTLAVGIIGVSPDRGWAATAHIPALRALPNYEIRAISAHSAESARAAGEAFGVRKVFSNHEQLVTQPDVDVVIVTVKVPHHRELVSAALAAGKAVYCEWPLGRDLEDAQA